MGTVERDCLYWQELGLCAYIRSFRHFVDSNSTRGQLCWLAGTQIHYWILRESVSSQRRRFRWRYVFSLGATCLSLSVDGGLFLGSCYRPYHRWVSSLISMRVNCGSTDIFQIRCPGQRLALGTLGNRLAHRPNPHCLPFRVSGDLCRQHSPPTSAASTKIYRSQ